MKAWFETWFNEDYLKLYASRSLEEAERQAAFIIEALQLKGTERVLDLGCGYGRHSLAFAKRGFAVLGVDLSSFLIARAKELLLEISSDQSLALEFLAADMRNLEKNPDKREIGQFDLIINLFTSFGYFAEDSENLKVFQEIFRHLKKGGKFFFDYLHPSKVKREHLPFETQIIEEETVEIYKEISDDFAMKKMVFPGREYEEKVKLYKRSQIEEMLLTAGFSIQTVWNDYAGHPWKEEGDRQLFYCEK